MMKIFLIAAIAAVVGMVWAIFFRSDDFSDSKIQNFIQQIDKMEDALNKILNERGWEYLAQHEGEDLATIFPQVMEGLTKENEGYIYYSSSYAKYGMTGGEGRITWQANYYDGKHRLRAKVGATKTKAKGEWDFWAELGNDKLEKALVQRNRQRYY